MFAKFWAQLKQLLCKDCNRGAEEKGNSASSQAPIERRSEGRYHSVNKNYLEVLFKLDQQLIPLEVVNFSFSGLSFRHGGDPLNLVVDQSFDMQIRCQGSTIELPCLLIYHRQDMYGVKLQFNDLAKSETYFSWVTWSHIGNSFHQIPGEKVNQNDSKLRKVVYSSYDNTFLSFWYSSSGDIDSFELEMEDMAYSGNCRDDQLNFNHTKSNKKNSAQFKTYEACSLDEIEQKVHTLRFAVMVEGVSKTISEAEIKFLQKFFNDPLAI